ncbi:MAG TPA: hypothetical protein VFP15_09390 [Gemmatimonadaceae bacterium]|nr:hypothetical protein [Gemmatimonadaceae bacterium]
MRIRLLLAATAAVTLAACSNTVTAPQKLSPPDTPKADITCRTGYHIATRSDGSQYCESDGGTQITATSPTTSTTK